MDKYTLIKNTLKNGDICELKTWDNQIIFGIYMDEYLYRKQENGIVCGMGGFETQVIAIRRPCSMRNTFQCFTDGDIYNYNYKLYGEFETVYEN